MLGSKNTDAGKHRLLITVHVISLMLSLSPTIVAPPQRTFQRGQPELQQEMDNMADYEMLIKKSFEFPTSSVDGYPALLTSKTSNLLTEAEHMLSRVKHLKERRWVEAFILRMKLLANVLEKSITRDNQTMSLHVENHTTASTPVIPTAPNWLYTTMAVPKDEVRRSEKSENTTVLSKFSRTLPTNDNLNDHAINKPTVTLDSSTEDDQLVHELEVWSLSETKATPTPEDYVTEEAKTSIVSSLRAKRQNFLENQKDAIKERLMHEIAQLQQLGETKEEIINGMHFDNLKFPDFTHPNFNQKLNEEDTNKFENAEDNLSDDQASERMNNIKNDESVISEAQSRIWKSTMDSSYHPAEPLKQNTFTHMHIKQPQSTSRVLTNHLNAEMYQSYHPNEIRFLPPGLDNTILKLQKSNQPNYLMNNHMAMLPKGYPNGHHVAGIPNAVRYNYMPQSGGMLHKNPALLPYYPHPQYQMKNAYGPYPYLHHWILRNITNPSSQPMKQPFFSKNFSDQQINSQLSDAMKRELRDGKIIVLSDSLVHSNFENKQGKTQEADGKKGNVYHADADGTVNGTQAQN